VVGSVAAPKFETFGAALDLRLSPQTYIGLTGEILNSDVDRALGLYRFPVTNVFAFASSTPQRLRYHEYSAAVTVNQLLSSQWSLGLSYKFTRSELEQTLPEVPLSLFAGARQFGQSDLHTASFYLLYSHPSGFFARADLNWYWQENRTETNSVSMMGVSHISVPLPGDQFPQVNFWVGYRLRRGLGDISLGLLNANNTDYKLNPLNSYTELPRERVVAARVRLRF
jgi:hypothetical protein